MAIVQGAMIGGSFLPEKEFKEIITELFLNTDNVKEMNRLINLALKNIKSKNLRAAYKNIEEFETKLLKNPSTSIMLITNLNSEEGNYKWYLNKNEKNVIQKGGKLSYSKIIKNSLIEEEISQILSKHLLDMIRTVDTTKMSDEEIRAFFNNYIFSSKKKKIDIGSRTHNSRKIKEMIYGQNPAYKGNIADAFIQHVANMHKQLLIGKMENIVPISSSVLQEEGSNFYQLLLDSTNNTPWFTGGDLILLNENREVIANIQLKTLVNEKASVVGGQGITGGRLSTYLIELKKLINNDNILDAKVFADKFYQTFATSGILDEVEDKIEDIVVKKVRNVLNLTS